EERATDNAFQIVINPASIQQAMFQHSVLCQTFLPYRNPGNDVTIWNQKQGHVNLAVQTTQVLNPRTGDYEVVGLPYGTKARLILAYLNSEAVKTQKKVIDVEQTMTAFIRRLGLSNDGRTIRDVKDQIRRLTSSIINMGYSKDGRGMQVNLQIVKAFDLWFPKDDRQRVIWTPTIQLTDDYFDSLIDHAIPLDERALIALSHNSMALDIYAWLAQRLHRIDPIKPQFIGWQNLKEQFGSNYSEMRKFKQVFRNTLKQVHMQYPMAKLNEVANKGLLLSHSAPPIPAKLFSVPTLPTKD
ncbi:MAG: plasmid encoded RepA protein, partial [Pedobacter sp.]